jgi:hypothetical protein
VASSEWPEAGQWLTGGTQVNGQHGPGLDWALAGRGRARSRPDWAQPARTRVVSLGR